MPVEDARTRTPKERHFPLTVDRSPFTLSLDDAPPPQPPDRVVALLVGREHFPGRDRRHADLSDLDARRVVREVRRFPHRRPRRQRRGFPRAWEAASPPPGWRGARGAPSSSRRLGLNTAAPA